VEAVFKEASLLTLSELLLCLVMCWGKLIWLLDSQLDCTGARGLVASLGV